MENTAIIFPGKEKWNRKNKNKNHQLIWKLMKGRVDPFALACESFNRKKHGLTQLEWVLSVPVEVLAWCGPCHSPQTLLPCSFLTVEKQEVLFINKPDRGHTQRSNRVLLLLVLGRGSRIRDKLLVRVRDKARLWKINSQLAFHTGP